MGLEVPDADDATQNTFVIFMERIPTSAGRSHDRTWLFGILYHKISESRRAVDRREETRDIDSVMEQRFRADGFWARPLRVRYTGHENEFFNSLLESVATGDLEQLGWMKKLEFRMHLMMCAHCRRYRAQIRAIGRGARTALGGRGPEPDRREHIEREVIRQVCGWGPDRGDGPDDS